GNGGNNGSQGDAFPDGQCIDGFVPSAGGCGAGYADRGCDQPPTCSGDPLLCAGIKEQHASRCADQKARGELHDIDAEKVALDALGLVAPVPMNLAEQIYDKTVGDGEGGQGLDTTGWGYNRTCPLEPKTFALMGQSVTVDFSVACTPLNLGGVLVMIMAYLAAARILFMQ
ncbi:MAG TPA: virulence factor TspB C-terminal domain-related protein, partial [Oleiagrimonas sp.]|nr:virulence factor TspB C-terminal domain-related protein [Oleiagrimonas sp.]